MEWRNRVGKTADGCRWSKQPVALVNPGDTRVNNQTKVRNFGSGTSCWPQLPRKASFSSTVNQQYRKPTQVGGMRILRCLWEPSFRNSAKYIRNFGRRIAVFTKNMVAEKCSRRLFNKNIGLRKVVKTTYGGWRLPNAGRLRGLVSRKAKLGIEAPVNGGRNYNGPKVAKFLVG